MAISKILTISTAHISKETAQLLESANANWVEDEANIILAVYKKSDYGWFIFVDPFCFDDRNIPNDLLKVIKFTKDNNCEWLCLDSDGEVLDCLDVYEW